MIKIVHILTDTNIGGAGVWLLNYLKSYDTKKYNVHVLLPQNSQLTQKVQDLGVKVTEVEHIKDMSFSRQGTKEFEKLFRKIKPQIVHSHASLSARLAAKKLGIKIVNTRHCLEDTKRFPKNLIYGFVNNHLSNIIIGVSRATCENLLADGVKKAKLRLVYNGVYPLKKLDEETKRQIRITYNIPENVTVVGIVARLEDVKNHELFLHSAVKIAKERPDTFFIIAGDGSCREKLINLCRELKIEDRVRFIGYQKDVSEIMNIIDINTLTSKREALSLSLIEGMSIEIPAVSTDSGGPCEVLGKNECGIIVENDNVEAFSNAVISLIDDKELRKKLGENGKKRAKSVFGIDKMTAQLDEIYTNLVNKA